MRIEITYEIENHAFYEAYIVRDQEEDHFTADSLEALNHLVHLHIENMLDVEEIAIETEMAKSGYFQEHGELPE